jgi:DNA invertase Pin-like site-specific DNA recombinase
MTETIYTTEKRHPQSTKPMKKGRPMSSGKYATREALEEAVFDRCFNRGWSARHIARVVGLSASTVSNIINRWKEKQSEHGADRS